MEDKRFTKPEKSWITYDAANSAFSMLSSSIIPIYFASLAKNAGILDHLSIWGVVTAMATLLVALTAPLLGALADYKGMKIRIFSIFLVVGLVGCVMMGIVSTWLAFAILFILAKFGYSSANVFYDSMLTDVTEDHRMDRVSTVGFAVGYISSCVPFIVSIAIILLYDKLGMSKTFATQLAFYITCAWWAIFSLPLLRKFQQKHYLETNKNLLKESFRRLSGNLRNIKGQKHIFLFMLAFFFYIDAVYTIIGMAASYGKTVGIDDQQLLMALLLTQIIAFPFAIIFGKLAKRFNTRRLIEVCILGYIFIALFAVQLDKAWEFWFLAAMVALFQGGIQALSRSYFGKIIPKERSNEYFGLFDIFGKYADILGPLMLSGTVLLTGIPNLGPLSLVLLLIAGFVLMRMLPKEEGVTNRHE